MSALHDFFWMNGDGVFVWPCYVLTVLVLSANVIFSRRRYAKLVHRIKTVHMRKT